MRRLAMIVAMVGFISAAGVGFATPPTLLDQFTTGFEAGEGYTGVSASDTSTTGMITNHADWSGGAQAGITNDNPDWGINADGSYGDEKVVNYESYTGDQCFRLDREYGSSGQGSLFGKTLTASMPTDGNVVKVSFAFKAVSGTPDDSHLSVQSGAASGTDKADHLAWIEYSSASGYNRGLSVGNWDKDNGGNMTFAATGLDPSVWHTCDATLTYGGVGGPDIISISVDGAAATSFPLDGTNAWRAANGFSYQSHDRVKFQCQNGAGTAGGIDTQSFDHSGFYFDDLDYQVLDSSVPIPEPAGLSLLGLGLVGLRRRRRS